MSTMIWSDSPEGRRIDREKRIHQMDSVKGAVAVHLVYNQNSIIVARGTLSASMAEARRLVHLLMEKNEDELRARFSAGLKTPQSPHATLAPISPRRVKALLAMGWKMFDPADYRAHHEQIVQTCFEVIAECDDPQVRLEAARLLQRVGTLPEDMQ